MKYRNPIIRGFHPDPSVCRVGKDYYLVTSSFEYLPGVPLFQSRDLVHWNQIGHCLTRDSQINLKFAKCSGGIFAPTIRFHEGIFYMITTNFGQGNFIVTSKNPYEGWSDPIWIPERGIDPSLFWEDGRTYVQLAVRTDSGNHILQFEIDVETGNIIGERRIISRGCGGRDVEAPHIYKRNGYYYLMTAEGGTREGHMVCIARSRSLWGPFHPCPYNPILSNRDHALEPLQNVGHGDLVDDNDGNWWMTALAVRQIKHKHNLGRETILVPVEWTEDGWPVVNERCAKEVIEIKYGFQTEENACVPLGNIPVKDNFDGKELLPCYNTMREFIPGHSMNLMNGKLCLTGNRWTLNDQETPVFIGRRQEEYSFRAETCMEFEPSIEKEEAGLALYMDTEHHMDFVIRKRHGNKVLFLRKTVNDLCTEEGKVELPEEQPVTLIIRGTRQYYIFSYQASGEEIIVGQTVIKNLATECANSAFTGVYIGMYASGNGHRMQATACYDYFLYENLPEEL